MPKKPKVLHISTSLENGGAEALLYSLVRHDATCDHMVISLYTDGFYGEKIRALGYEVHSIGMDRGRLSIGAVLKLAKLIKGSKADIVQTWMYHANFLGGLLARLIVGKKVFWGVHNTNMDPKQSSRSMVFCNKACALLSRFGPSKIIHSSKTGMRILIEDNYYEPKLAVIPGGYDLSKFSPRNQSKIDSNDVGDSNEEFVFAMIARWNPQKDHYNLIEAVRLLSGRDTLRFRVLLVGPQIDTGNRNLMDTLTQAEVTHLFKLLGPIEDIPSFLQTIGVHILSSAYGESFPNVVNEAMACTVPCIVTDVGDSAYIVGDTGWVVPPKSPEELADAMEAALTASVSNGWADKKANARRRVVDNFGIDATIAAYHSVWGVGSKGNKEL